jgi:hypothetical protein
VQSEGKPSNVKPYQHLITRKYFKEDKKVDINIIKEEYGILVNIHGTRNQKPLFNKLLLETNNHYKLDKLQQQYIESKERKL